MRYTLMILVLMLLVVPSVAQSPAEISKKLNQYVEVELTSDVGTLSEKQRSMVGVLIEAAKITCALSAANLAFLKLG